jgi:type I restriction enzyme S subunit
LTSRRKNVETPNELDGEFSCEFREVIDSIRNGVYQSDDEGRKANLVKMGQLFNYRFLHGQEDYDKIELNQKNTAKLKLEKGDLLFARTSKVREGTGKCAKVEEHRTTLIPESNMMRVRLNKSNVIPDYYFYYFDSENGRDEVKKRIRQTSVSSIAQSDLKEIKVPAPSKDTQEKIADILKSLDMKIEVNRRINKILEEIAKTLFKSWFDRFEPYSNFKNSELGEIPEKFEVKNLVDIADVTYGYSFSSDEFNEDSKGVPVIRIRNLPDNETDQYSTEEFNEKYLVESGDVLAGMDGEFRPYIWKGPQAGLNQRVCKFEGVKPQYSEIYLWNVVRRPLFKLEQAKTGTTVIHLGKGDIDQLRIPIPDDQSLEEFNEILNPLYEEMINRVKENRMLEELRDTLLPKLMSDEIRVDDIESDELEVDSEV